MGQVYSTYSIGRLPLCDIQMEHPVSVDRISHVFAVGFLYLHHDGLEHITLSCSVTVQP